MLVIGITGTLGSGKGTVVEYLQSKGFSHYSVSGFLKKELEKRNLPSDRDNLQKIGNELREKYGPDYVVKTLFTTAIRDKKNTVIESIRNPKEAEFIKSQKDSLLLAVDADIKLRYNRIIERKDDKDNVSFEQFKLQEEKELQSQNPNAQNLLTCISMADYKLDNRGTKQQLYGQVENIIKNY